MTVMKLALAPGESRRLHLSWQESWTQFRVSFDDYTVGTFAGEEELKQGKRFQLANGSTLHVQLIRNEVEWDIQVLCDGRRLTHAEAQPRRWVTHGSNLLYVLAGLNVVFGVIALILNIELAHPLGTLGSFLFAGLLATFGYFTSQGHRVAPVLAIVLYVSDTLYAFALAKAVGGPPPTASLFMRVFIISAMCLTVSALNTLARAKDRRELESAPRLHPGQG